MIQLVWTAKDQPPELKINGEQVKRDELDARLAEIFLKRAEKVAFVRGDDNVDFQDVADVIDVGASRRRAAGRPADKGERIDRGIEPHELWR